MSKAFQRYIATLLLSAVSAYFGHLLGEGMADHWHTDIHQIALTDHCDDEDCDEDSSPGGHHHEHGTSCDQWLCSGFSGVILQTEARVLKDAHLNGEPFCIAENVEFHSRTTEPPKDPPRVI